MVRILQRIVLGLCAFVAGMALGLLAWRVVFVLVLAQAPAAPTDVHVAAALVASGSCSPSPCIASTSGSLTHGSTVTVAGSGFGTKVASSPWKWDTMNGTNGQELDARGWLVETNTPRPVLSSSTQLRGTPGRTTSAYLHQTGGDVPGFAFGDDFSSYLSLTAGSAVNKRAPPAGMLLLDYWMYFQNSTSTNNYKFLRWHSANDPAVQGNRYWSMPEGSTATESSTWTYFGPIGVADIAGWHHHTVWLYWSPTQSFCFYRHAIDGAVKFNSDSSGNYAPVTGGFSSGAWPPLPGGDRLSLMIFEHQDGTDGSPTRDGFLAIEDLAVDDGAGAVYLGNGSTWATSTHTEYQPYSSWADGSIAVTLNRGTFGASASVYVYVVTNGRVTTSGFPVTLG